MLTSVHDNGTFEIGGGAESVGAADIFRPDSSRANTGSIRGVAETGVGDDVEQQSFGSREGDHEVGAGDLLMQRVHLGERKAAHERAALLFLAQNGRADELGRGRT